MNAPQWDIRLNGRAWPRELALTRHAMIAGSCRIEMVDGKLFWTDEERLVLLAILLENVGALSAVKLGNPDVWRAAVESLGKL